jgi:hypothetical protein
MVPEGVPPLLVVIAPLDESADAAAVEDSFLVDSVGPRATAISNMAGFHLADRQRGVCTEVPSIQRTRALLCFK